MTLFTSTRASPLNYLLVLDLDQTLLHTIELSDRNLNHPRPNLPEFITACFQRFRWVAVWTARNGDFVQDGVQRILKGTKHTVSDFLFVWDGSRVTVCIPDHHEEEHYKKLSKVWKVKRFRRMGISARNTIILDDVDEYCMKNFANHLWIPDYWFFTGVQPAGDSSVRLLTETKDQPDTCLLSLIDFFDSLEDVIGRDGVDVRCWRVMHSLFRPVPVRPRDRLQLIYL